MVSKKGRILSANLHRFTQVLARKKRPQPQHQDLPSNKKQLAEIGGTGAPAAAGQNRI